MITRTEAAEKLADRVKDHLAARDFRDELLHALVSVTYDDRVMVTLHPFQYSCDTCAAKGFAPRLVDAFKQMIRPTWCEACMELTNRRYEHKEQLVPRLLDVLEAEFTAALSLPGSPFSQIVVTG